MKMLILESFHEIISPFELSSPMFVNLKKSIYIVKEGLECHLSACIINTRSLYFQKIIRSQYFTKHTISKFQL